MSKKLRELRAKKADLVAKAGAVFPAEGEPTAEQFESFKTLSAQIEGINTQIEAEEFLSRNAIEVPANAVIVVEENGEKDGKRGFASMGHFLKAVSAEPMGEGSARPGYAMGGELFLGQRNAAAPSTYGNESVGPDGGFSVPPDFATEIMTHSLGEDSLLGLTDNTNVSGNSMVFPKDETTPWGTDGIRAYWQAEAGVVNATKPKLSTTTLRLHKLMALIPLTDELLADTNALDSYVPKKVGDSIRWKTNEAILFGSGAGQPLGAFNSNAVITVAKESGQATLTLQAMNLAKMISRLPAGSFNRAVWMVNNDVLPALFTLTLGNYPIYLPGGASVGGMQVNPYGMLLGRPIIVTQHAKSFTNQGDVLAIDPSYVRSIQKAGGLQTAMSMHLYFDADATAFRTTFRVDAQPKIVNPIAPFNGSNTMSPFVQLGAR